MFKTPSLWMSAAILAGTLRAEPEIPAVTEKMKEFVKAREIAGAVTLVADESRILHLSAVGNATDDQPMKTDSVFWIASMTKPVTATAAMMMREEGKLSVDDPVSKYLPEFQNLKDAEGKPVVVTIQQCLTHTSGLRDVPGGETADVNTLAGLMPFIVAKPVKFAPGSKWEYCQSGINVVARIVEAVSGSTFPDFLEARLFKPLGMKDTSFYPDENRITRFAASYRRKPDGNLERVEVNMLGGKSISDRNRYPRANGGLFSTAEDYSKFARMILNGGELDGHRYLQPESVKEMTTIHTGDLSTGFTGGNGWGLGWCVVREPQGVSGTLSPGTYGHGGMFGTQAWIDPVKKRIQLLMIQRADIPNSDDSDVRHGFHQAVAGQP